MTVNSTKTRLSESPILLVSPFFLWGTAMVAMKAVIPYTSPLFIGAFRLLPAGLLVLIVAAIQGREQPKTRLAWLWIGGFAFVDGFLFQGCLAEGLLRTGAGLGSVIIDSQPLAVALLSRWLFAEVIGLWGWMGLFIGIVGISLIGLPVAEILNNSAGQLAFPSLTWDAVVGSGEIWMLLASLSMAVGTVMIRFVSRHTDPVIATGWHMIFGGLPLLLLSGIEVSEPWQHIPLKGWLGLGYATVFGSAIAYGVFFFLAAKGNLTSLSSLTFLTPVFALSFGNLLLGEILEWWQWIGVGLTLVSIFLINQREQTLPTVTDQSWRYRL